VEEQGPSEGRESEHRRAERRRLWERRSPDARRGKPDRRSRDRRNSGAEAPAERRRGSDRRGPDRRAAADRRSLPIRRRGRGRRRTTPTPYSMEQMDDLKGRFAHTGPVSCPACNSAFTLGPVKQRPGGTARRVVCLGCSRAAVVPNTCAARVLVIEQSADRRSALRAVLASAGHEVIEAADGGVALLAYQTVPADVVFIDAIDAGRMDAATFVRRLRRGFPDARIVAIAARPSYKGVDPLAISRGLGAARTIRLPFSRDDVLRAVEEARP
jgi:CheY-like chemotaxis protein